MSVFDHAVMPLIRPALYRDEWRESYLARVARANGVRATPRDVDRIRPFLSTAAANANAPAMGIDFLDEGVLPAWAVQKAGAVIRYCPACLAESHYVRSRWRLRSYEVCTKHHMRLKRGLFDRAVTNWYAMPHRELVDELTEEQIWNGAICPMPADREHAVAMWSTVDSEVDQGISGPLLWAILGEHLIDAIVTAAHHPEYPLRGESRLRHRAHWLTVAKTRLDASQDGIAKLLRSLPSHADRRVVVRTLKALVQDERQQQTLLSTLPLQHLLDTLIGMAPDSISAVHYGALPSALHPEGYVSLDHAEAIIGCSAGLMQYLFRAGFFVDIRKIKFGRRMYRFIIRKEVEACRRWYTSCWTAEQLRMVLRIDKLEYVALLDSGALSPMEFGAWTLFQQTNVAAFLNKLESMALLCPASRGHLQPLLGNWLRKKTRSREVVAQLLREVASGMLPLYRDPQGQGLQAYFVDVVSVKRAIQLSDECRARRRHHAVTSFQFSLLESIQ
jgi:hypothetical protein